MALHWIHTWKQLGYGLVNVVYSLQRTDTFGAYTNKRDKDAVIPVHKLKDFRAKLRTKDYLMGFK